MALPSHVCVWPLVLSYVVIVVVTYILPLQCAGWSLSLATALCPPSRKNVFFFFFFSSTQQTQTQNAWILIFNNKLRADIYHPEIVCQLCAKRMEAVMLNKRERHTSERKKVPSCGSAYFFFSFKKRAWEMTVSSGQNSIAWKIVQLFFLIYVLCVVFCWLFLHHIVVAVQRMWSWHRCWLCSFFFVLPSNIETKQKTIAQYICWLLIMAIYNNNECTLMALMFMDAADDQSAIVDRREK